VGLWVSCLHTPRTWCTRACSVPAMRTAGPSPGACACQHAHQRCGCCQRCARQAEAQVESSPRHARVSMLKMCVRARARACVRACVHTCIRACGCKLVHVRTRCVERAVCLRVRLNDASVPVACACECEHSPGADAYHAVWCGWLAWAFPAGTTPGFIPVNRKSCGTSKRCGCACTHKKVVPVSCCVRAKPPTDARLDTALLSRFGKCGRRATVRGRGSGRKLTPHPPNLLHACMLRAGDAICRSQRRRQCRRMRMPACSSAMHMWPRAARAAACMV